MTSAPDGSGALLQGHGSWRPAVLAVVVTALGVFALARTSSAPGDGPHEWAGSTMGTTYSVKVDADIRAAEAEEISAAITTVLDRINHLMSTYDSTSQISRFNRHANSEPFPISTELVDVLTLAQEVNERSDGLFDITVGPLVDAWGFGPYDARPTGPSDATRTALRAHVGSRRLRIDSAEGSAAKEHPGIRVDLSAVAKGYAVDLVAQALEERGFTSFLVEIGGELRAGAPKRSGEAWSVGIEWPEPTVRRLYATFHIERLAVATSGDYRNLAGFGDQRLTHLIDPRTGGALPFIGVSVSVVHAEAAAADAWATALSVAGTERGYELAIREGVAALFLRAEGDEVVARATPLFFERVTEFTRAGG